jgi:alpha-ketoglutarate-dependent taurine dioxygenase
MKINLHENGWTVIVTDYDLKKASQDEIDIIGCWLASNTCVVFKGQDMTVAEEIEIVKKFGTPEQPIVEDESFSEEQITENKNLVERYHVPDSENIIIRVTGEQNHKGEIGLFGDVHDLDWHANKVEHHDRNPIVWLRSIRGSKGSKTSWTNQIVAYNNLPEALKKICANLQVNYTYYNGYKDVHIMKTLMKDRLGVPDFFPPLVYTNEGGYTGLYFSWMQAHLIGPRMNEKTAAQFNTKLRDHILGNEKHLYHHYWDDGDIVISEQWLGVHKRWPCENLDKRLLHRATVNFKNIDFSKMDYAKSLLTK